MYTYINICCTTTCKTIDMYAYMYIYKYIRSHFGSIFHIPCSLQTSIFNMSSFDDLLLEIGKLGQEEATLVTQLISVRARMSAAKAALAKEARASHAGPKSGMKSSRDHPKKPPHRSKSSSSNNSSSSDHDATEPSPTSAPVVVHPPTGDSGVVEEGLVHGALLSEPPAGGCDVGGGVLEHETPLGEPPAGGDVVGEGVLAHEAPLAEPPADSKKRKWTRRPVCPDSRCRRCWYSECGIPGGPKHTLDGMCLVTLMLPGR